MSNTVRNTPIDWRKEVIRDIGSPKLGELVSSPQDLAPTNSVMPFATTKHYAGLAAVSSVVRNIIIPSRAELDNLNGDPDPGNKGAFSPIPGVVHKYREIVRVTSVLSCPAHCRFCYVAGDFTGATGHHVADRKDTISYIKEHPEINEVLLSGGDPMILPNHALYSWLSEIASQTNVNRIRIGTKVLAFQPDRFDKNFFEMLDKFKSEHPQVSLIFMVHFNHADEFLDLDEHGKYKISSGELKWASSVDLATKELLKRADVINQTPIISGINDDVQSLKTLLHELNNHGIRTKYLFQCRPRIGHMHFALPLEKTFELACDAITPELGPILPRVVMSTEIGKVQVIGMDDSNIVLSILRTPKDFDEISNRLMLFPRNREAYWLDDYLERTRFEPNFHFIAEGIPIKQLSL